MAAAMDEHEPTGLDIRNSPVTAFSITTLHSTSKTSYCWKYFGKLLLSSNNNKKKHVLTDNVFCNRCLQEAQNQENDSEADPDDVDVVFGRCNIKHYSTSVSTTNLIRHLMDDHNISEEPRSRHNATLDQFFRRTPRPAAETQNPDKKKWLLGRDLAILCSRGLLPFSFVDKDAVKDFFKKYSIISSDDNMPDRTTVSRGGLDDVHRVMKASVKEIIADCKTRFGSITFDLWSDRYQRRSYITFTFHIINDTWKLISMTLSTWLMRGSHTSDAICQKIDEVMTQFDLQRFQIVGVTDAANNVKRAAMLAGLMSHLCLGHGLHNLVVEDGIKKVAQVHEVVAKCKKVVTKLRFRIVELQEEAAADYQELVDSIEEVGRILEMDENDPITETFVDGEPVAPVNEEDDMEEIIQPELPPAPGTLKRNVPNRWHSTTIMLGSMITTGRTAINSVLCRMEHNGLQLTMREWTVMEEVQEFLSAFKPAVATLSAQKSPTLNLAMLMRSQIEVALSDGIDDDLDQPLIIVQLKESMRRKLDFRFPVNDLLVAAALLDPRFVNLANVNYYIANHVDFNVRSKADLLTKVVRDNIRVSDIATGSPNTHSAQTEPRSSNLLELARRHSDLAAAATGSTGRRDKVLTECQVYLGSCKDEDVPDQPDGILQYWREKEKAFPNLAALAKMLLCVPATSTPSERNFNIAGLFVNAKRANLSPTVLNKQTFVHDNYELCMEKVLSMDL